LQIGVEAPTNEEKRKPSILARKNPPRDETEAGGCLHHSMKARRAGVGIVLSRHPTSAGGKELRPSDW
jgi:hypothetical protein